MISNLKCANFQRCFKQLFPPEISFSISTDQNLKIFYGAVQAHTHSIFNI